jgi:hypothetical protein
MKLISLKTLFLIMLVCLQTACTGDDDDTTIGSFANNSRYNMFSGNDSYSRNASMQTPLNNQKYLAHSHRFRIDLNSEDLQQTYQKVLDNCNNDTAHQCTLLHSSIESGKRARGEIKLRIKPQGVAGIVELTTSKGTLHSQSTDIEDLGDEFVDTQKRLDQLAQYQAELEKLQLTENQDIDALIKLTAELSTVQTDLEYIKTKKAKLLKRVQMDIVNITLYSKKDRSFWQPITTSVSEFGSHFSQGISMTIKALAFILPWAAIILLFIYIIRLIWRKTKVN